MRIFTNLHKKVLAVVAVSALLGFSGAKVLATSSGTDHRPHDFTPTWQEVNRNIELNPANPAPPEVVAQLVSLEVSYKDFWKRPHKGIIEVNRALKDDVITFFKYAYYLNFSINEVAVSSDPRFNWDDNKLMAANVTSSFNYRTIAGSNTPSQHGLGRAMDVNPRQNPYIVLDDQGNPVVAPRGAEWLAGTPGTLHRDHALIQLMLSRGWVWGGNWTLQDTDGAVIDYQHLQKRAPAASAGAQSTALKEL